MYVWVQCIKENFAFLENESDIEEYDGPEKNEIDVREKAERIKNKLKSKKVITDGDEDKQKPKEQDKPDSDSEEDILNTTEREKRLKKEKKA